MRPRRRRVLWGLLGGAAGLSLLAGLFLAFGVDWLARRTVEKAVRGALGSSIEIGDFRVRFKGGHAQLAQARIGNPGGYQEPLALEVVSLDAFVEPGSIFSREILIHVMLAVRPQVTVEFLDGASNVAVLVARLIDAIPADAPRFRIERLRVREALVRFRSSALPGGETVFRLPDLEVLNFGDAPDTASPANILLALFFQLLAGGALEQEQVAFPEGLRKSFGDELKKSSAALRKPKRE
jgi:hypothetical protein